MVIIHTHTHAHTHTCTHSHITGLVVGGVWGLYEGIKNPEGRTARLRMNSILNGCTRRGPFLGNTLAVLGECVGGSMIV